MLDLKTLTSLVVRGAEAARTEADRVLAELRERGDVSAEEAREIRKAVLEAVENNRAFLEENVVGPLRSLLGGLAGALGAAKPARHDAILEKLAEIERKLEELESRPAGAPGPGTRHKKAAAAERRSAAKPRKERG